MEDNEKLFYLNYRQFSKRRMWVSIRIVSFFLIRLLTIDCGYGSNVYTQPMF